MSSKKLVPKEKEVESWINIYKDMSKEGLKSSFKVNRQYTLAKDKYTATLRDEFLSVALAIRDRIVERWINTQQSYHKNNVNRVYYLSMEFLIGRLLGNYIYNLGLEGEVEGALKDLGVDLEEVREQEIDAALGNGGLGRLAACFLDSMATLKIPAHGYGIRYDYGIFNQKIKDGYQVEFPDEWLRLGSPWEFPRPEYTVKIRFYGHTEMLEDENDSSKYSMRWVGTDDVLAVPYDIPIIGYKNDIVNTLRLWSARSTEEFDFDYFNNGDYEQAVYRKIFSENISKVLYPNDNQLKGKELRLKQEYFFTAASIADILRRFKVENPDIKDLPKKVSIQLNDTHPGLGIVELMRVLLDEYKLDWETAWEITSKTFAYTNHTLMPEALETWAVELIEKVLPRHLQIIYEINARFLSEVSKAFPGDDEKIQDMSLIAEGDYKKVRMAQLCVVGSYSVNGVSKLHSELLKNSLFNNFYKVWPDKFNNKTNGITPRRWLLKANPKLSNLITDTIGETWPLNLSELKKIIPYKEKSDFRQKWRGVKIYNKRKLALYVEKTMGISINTDSMFDVQVKRIHEYKRQLLFAFYMISQYLKLKNAPDEFIQPRTFFVGGKAAPAYVMAKLSIKLINDVGNIINQDKNINDKIKVIFLENYRVSLAEKIFPASELSEQISTAGMEASGTGNMKFMLNGALTIGTLDGANVEMAELVNDDEIFIFGLKESEVCNLKASGYNPQDYVQKSFMLQEIQRLLKNNFFSMYNPGIFDPIIETCFQHDPYLICADFESYCQMQDKVSREYQNKEEWTKKSISNVANAGFFSSDRTISEYATDIWNVPCQKF